MKAGHYNPTHFVLEAPIFHRNLYNSGNWNPVYINVIKPMLEQHFNTDTVLTPSGWKMAVISELKVFPHTVYILNIKFIHSSLLPYNVNVKFLSFELYMVDKILRSVSVVLMAFHTSPRLRIMWFSSDSWRGVNFVDGQDVRSP